MPIHQLTTENWPWTQSPVVASSDSICAPKEKWDADLTRKGYKLVRTIHLGTSCCTASCRHACSRAFWQNSAYGFWGPSTAFSLSFTAVLSLLFLFYFLAKEPLFFAWTLLSFAWSLSTLFRSTFCFTRQVIWPYQSSPLYCSRYAYPTTAATARREVAKECVAHDSWHAFTIV